MRGVVTGQRFCGTQVAQAIRRGLLPHPKGLTCADCGGAAVEYDHRDYNRPLDVAPVCRRCNLRRGKAIPKLWERDELVRALARQVSGHNWEIVPWAKRWCLRQLIMRCKLIEESAVAWGIKRHELRPDIFGKRAA